MANQQDIESPPWIGEVSAQMLYDRLELLRKWVMHYRAEINRSLGQDMIPAVREFPEKKAYLCLPVRVQMEHIGYAQLLRKQWDHLVAVYEDAWDCQACARQRAALVQHAALILNDAFTPYEIREAREQQGKEKWERAIKKLMERFDNLFEEDDEEAPPKGKKRQR